jgi:uncharacterized protein with HEPN domain
MSRDVLLYIEDILASCQKVQTYTAGASRQEFEQDDKTFDAVVRNLEIIGEAAKHVPDDIREQLSEIAWRNIAGLRDFLAHAYFGIDNDILWDVIDNKIPELRQAVERYLNKSNSGN